VSSKVEQMTSLRNERKACHFWVDNEVADCYQPIVGADAIWVYCRIARYANGAWIVSPRLRGTSDTRVGLREMAEWCGKSVDTVARCLEVLELVGLIRAERGTRSKGRYALADVKDLVIREGGQYDREIGGYRLPTARMAELKEQVRALRVKLARKSPLMIVEAEPEPAAASVAQSDSLDRGEFAALEAGCDSSVAPVVQNCTSGATATFSYRSKTSKPKTTPPTPIADATGELCFQETSDAGKKETSAAGVADELMAVRSDHPNDPVRDEAQDRSGDERVDSLRKAGVGAVGGFVQPIDGGVERAVDQVCSALGIANHRKRKLLRAAILLAAEKGEPPPTIALEMIAAVRDQDEAHAMRRLRFKYGLRTFFGDGIWRDRNRWAWDVGEIKLQSEARVGSWG
jgi:hypothetical protein